MSTTGNNPHRVDSIPTRSIHAAVESLENTPEWRVVQDLVDLLEVGDVIAMADVPNKDRTPNRPPAPSKILRRPPSNPPVVEDTSEPAEALESAPEPSREPGGDIARQRFDPSQRSQYPTHYSGEDAIADRAVAIVNERLRAGGNWITFDEALELARQQ